MRIPLKVPPYRRINLSLAHHRRLINARSKREGRHPGGHRAPPEPKNWRSAFQIQSVLAPPAKRDGPSVPEADSTIFIVLSQEPRADDMVRFHFFSARPAAAARADGRSAAPQIVALPLPPDGDIRRGDPSMRGILQLISALSRAGQPSASRYGYGSLWDPHARAISTKSLHPALDAILATGAAFASTEDFVASVRDSESRRLRPAQFGALRLKVAENDAEYSLEGAVALHGNVQPRRSRPKT